MMKKSDALSGAAHPRTIRIRGPRVSQPLSFLAHQACSLPKHNRGAERTPLPLLLLSLDLPSFSGMSLRSSLTLTHSSLLYLSHPLHPPFQLFHLPLPLDLSIIQMPSQYQISLILSFFLRDSLPCRCCTKTSPFPTLGKSLWGLS